MNYFTVITTPVEKYYVFFVLFVGEGWKRPSQLGDISMMVPYSP
jgi:p-aminobenzoyl-glutamate transporter AbgT